MFQDTWLTSKTLTEIADKLSQCVRHYNDQKNEIPQQHYHHIITRSKLEARLKGRQIREIAVKYCIINTQNN